VFVLVGDVRGKGVLGKRRTAYEGAAEDEVEPEVVGFCETEGVDDVFGEETRGLWGCDHCGDSRWDVKEKRYCSRGLRNWTVMSLMKTSFLKWEREG
jgi:hypothetical protein